MTGVSLLMRSFILSSTVITIFGFATALSVALRKQSFSAFLHHCYTTVTYCYSVHSDCLEMRAFVVLGRAWLCLALKTPRPGLLEPCCNAWHGWHRCSRLSRRFATLQF